MAIRLSPGFDSGLQSKLLNINKHSTATYGLSTRVVGTEVLDVYSESNRITSIYGFAFNFLSSHYLCLIFGCLVVCGYFCCCLFCYLFIYFILFVIVYSLFVLLTLSIIYF